MASARELGMDGGSDVVVCLECVIMYASACCGAESAAATPASAGSRKLLSFIFGGFCVAAMGIAWLCIVVVEQIR